LHGEDAKIALGVMRGRNGGDKRLIARHKTSPDDKCGSAKIHGKCKSIANPRQPAANYRSQA
jgi:hypothetical protein